MSGPWYCKGCECRLLTSIPDDDWCVMCGPIYRAGRAEGWANADTLRALLREAGEVLEKWRCGLPPFTDEHGSTATWVRAYRETEEAADALLARIREAAP